MKPLSFLFLFSIIAQTLCGQPAEIIYVGTFSVRGSQGIYVFEFDRVAASLKQIQNIEGPASPSFIEVHPSGRFLYSVNRGGTSKSGTVVAYRIDSSTGKLTFLNSKPSFGLGPCHVAIDPNGSFAYVSHYQEGTLATYRLMDDGSIGERTDSIRYTGQGVNSERQERPHIHSVTFVPAGTKFLVADLGTDHLYSYQVDSQGKPRPDVVLETKPGSGPRHMAFHANGKFLFVSEELTSTVTSFDASNQFHEIQRNVPSLPSDFSQPNTSADIHVSPDGKFLYLSNRGHDAIAIFSISRKGKITLIGHQPTLGRTPRHFMITPDGEFMLVANQDSDNIIIFRRNAKTGLLSKAGESFMPSPVCIKMLKRH